jgi:crotonobetainyl-CoA:carnitine CoA-transferase CaiB-like acyl-CoA transferase
VQPDRGINPLESRMQALKGIRIIDLSRALSGPFCSSAGLPAGPINTLDEVFRDAEVLHSRLVEAVEHPTLGSLRQVVTSVFTSAASGKPPPPVSSRAPPLGEHTVAVLREAGFDTASIDALLAAKAAQQGECDSPTIALERIGGVAQ